MTTNTTTKKITMATIKAFIKKNRSKLFIKCLSGFDGNADGVRECEDHGFSPALEPDEGCNHSNRHGIHGAWFVGRSRDYFTAYSEGGWIGYEVSNCCGSFVLAICDPTLNATVRTGTEGPRHDPYGFKEVTVEVRGVPVTMHCGLGLWVKHDAVKESFAEVSDAAKCFEKLTGCSFDALVERDRATYVEDPMGSLSDYV